LVIAVRVDRDLVRAAEFGDGCVSDLGTFQKLYSQREFREYVETVLGTRVHVAALGVAYVFNDEDIETRYLANRAFTRRLEYPTDLVESFSKNADARRYVALCNRLGRLALPEEFPAFNRLQQRFGSSYRIERLALRHVNPVAFEGSCKQRKEDILTYL